MFLAVQGRELLQIRRSDNHAPRVGAGIARQALQLQCQVDNFACLGVGSEQMAQLTVVLHGLLDGHSHRQGRDQSGDLLSQTQWKPQHPRRVLDCGARRQAIEGDDLRHPVLAVFGSHVLQHALPPLAAEVDIDIRHGYPLGIQEAFEDQPVMQRVDSGDTQGVTDERTGCRTPTRSHRDIVVARPTHDVRDNQEIAGIVHAPDHVQFGLQAFLVFLRKCDLGIPGVVEAELPNQTRARLRFEKLPFAAARGDPRLRQHGLA